MEILRRKNAPFHRGYLQRCMTAMMIRTICVPMPIRCRYSVTAIPSRFLVAIVVAEPSDVRHFVLTYLVVTHAETRSILADIDSHQLGHFLREW